MTRAAAGAAGATAAAFVLALSILVVLATGPVRAAAGGARLGARCTITEPAGMGTVRLDAGQVGNARAVAAVARSLALPERASAVALMTAMQESSLGNLDHGDAAGPDSRGLFQQRPMDYPGVSTMDPAQASRAFYRRLVAVAGWQDMPMWQAAQAVQHSANGSRYARWQGFGVHLAAALYGRAGGSAGVRCEGAGGSGLDPGAAVEEKVRAVLRAAASQLGRPYVWGGGDADGPTGGLDGLRPPGFDCSGLMIYAFAGVGVALPHSSRAQYDAGRRVPLSQAQPGDLIFLSSDGTAGGIHHVAMLWSATRIVEAQDFGVPVHVRDYAGPAEPEILPDAVRLLS